MIKDPGIPFQNYKLRLKDFEPGLWSLFIILTFKKTHISNKKIHIFTVLILSILEAKILYRFQLLTQNNELKQ